MTVTCTDQPQQQVIGLVSAGPDGIAGNRDDVQSWMLGDEVTELLAGPRWVAKQIKPKGTTTPKGSGSPKGSGAKPAIIDADGDGIPDER